MKVKSLYEQFKQEFMASSVEYCCYCLETRDDKIGCCHENHFVEFKYLPDDEQKHIINSEIEQSFGAE
jgi:hypothetical protein